VARIDYERDADASGDIERAVIEKVERLGRGAKALMVSDYLKGTITLAVMRSARALAERDRRSSLSPRRVSGQAGERASVPLIVDPKIPHLDFYAGATLVTPNHHEAEAATHLRLRDDDEARAVAREFRARARCDAVLVTRGEHGMWLSDSTVEGPIPAVAREVSDVTGAGDTVVATLALALAAGATMVEAAVLANVAAGIVVGKFGPATVTALELTSSF
jgi:D-beta-D-heptose 7-phosphate kinase/D-beta-D-heptose 1-phosphate adenosyltransferase